MSTRRPTIAELRFPANRTFQALTSAWAQDAAAILLGFVWQGYDTLRDGVLEQVDVSEADEDLERTVTQLLEPRIRLAMSGDEPFDIQHGSYEEESRQPAPAQPPEYDVAFVLRANPPDHVALRGEGDQEQRQCSPIRAGDKGQLSHLPLCTFLARRSYARLPARRRHRRRV